MTLSRNRFRPSLDALDGRIVPALVAGGIPDDAVLVTPDAGGVPRIKIIDPSTGEDIGEVEAYEDSFRGGVRAALGDITGDGTDDLVIAPGVGGGPRLRIVDGVSGATLRDFFAYEPGYTGGVYVSVGDVNGDGRGDIVTGTGKGGGPRVRVLDGATLGASVLKDYFAYESSFRGGVQVAAGDVSGDGRADIITGTGVGGGPRVVVFDAVDDRVLRNFFAYEDSFRGGVQVGAGDLNGDGRDDVLVGSGVGGGPVVRAVSGADGSVLASLVVDDSDFRGGVRVDSVDSNGDGFDDLVCRTRRGNDDAVRVFDGRTGGFAIGFAERVDDNPSPSDSAGGVSAPPAGTAAYFEGRIAAVDPAAGTVTATLFSGASVVLRAGPGTEVKRDDAEVPLSALVVGEKVEALVAASGIAVEIEAKTGADDADDNGDDSGSGGSGGGSQAGETRVEGTITAVDAAGRVVTIRTQGGASVAVRVAAGAKVERNDDETTLSAFRVGDRAEARVGADGLAYKVEAEGA